MKINFFTLTLNINSYIENLPCILYTYTKNAPSIDHLYNLKVNLNYMFVYRLRRFGSEI